MSNQKLSKPEGESQLKLINEWAERLSSKARIIIDNTDIEELTPKERLDHALKCIGQMQRLLALGKQIGVLAPEGAQNIYEAAIKGLMRGEVIALPGMNGEIINMPGINGEADED